MHVLGGHAQNSGRAAVEVEYIRHDQVAAPGAVDDAAGEEHAQKEDPVDELRAGAGQADLITEPVDIEEWRGELKEDKYGGVEIDERALWGVSQLDITDEATRPSFGSREQAHVGYSQIRGYTPRQHSPRAQGTRDQRFRGTRRS